MRPDEYEDLDEYIDLVNTEEEAADMHHSLFFIPKSYRYLNPPVIKSLKEQQNAN